MYVDEFYFNTGNACKLVWMTYQISSIGTYTVMSMSKDNILFSSGTDVWYRDMYWIESFKWM